MVGTGARLHGDQAPWWQLGTPGHEVATRQRPIRHQLLRCIDSMNLNDVFCQINANSCNLAHGTSPFKGCRLTSKPILAQDAVTRKWEVPSYSPTPVSYTHLTLPTN